jgi:prophage regulatory protein
VIMIKKNRLGSPSPPREDAKEPVAVESMEDRAAPDERPRTMLTEKQVLAIIPIARSTLWRMEAAGRFPKGVYPLGEVRRKFWYADEIAAWQIAMDGQVGRRRRPRAKKPKPAKQTA